MVLFRKLCRITYVHKTESVSAMDHEQSLTVSATDSYQIPCSVTSDEPFDLVVFQARCMTLLTNPQLTYV